MHAAVVRSFDRPPRYEEFEIPQASGKRDVVVEVLQRACVHECVPRHEESGQ